MSPRLDVAADRLVGIVSSAALVCAFLSATILVWYLALRPPLRPGVRVLMFMGLGLFPIAMAFIGNVAGYENSKRVQFCNSCHVMQPFVNETYAEKSTTLAALHSRSELTRGKSCYYCHSDYGVFGAVTTKLNGMRHFVLYYAKYRGKPFVPGSIHLYRPYTNDHCLQCHSGTLASFQNQPEHAAVRAELSRGEIQCVNGACHGPAHPAESPPEESRRRVRPRLAPSPQGAAAAADPRPGGAR